MRKFRFLLTCMLLTGCAGLQRSCSNDLATTFGANWIVVQYRYDGTPFHCWKLYGASVANLMAFIGKTQQPKRWFTYLVPIIMSNFFLLMD